jgi:hypothetical protein
MMDGRWLSAIPLAFLLVVTASKSQPTVSDFHDQCSSLQIEERTFCTGFLLGYLKAQTIELVFEDGTPISEALICINHEITSGQLRRVFIDWAEQNSDRASDERWVGVLSALSMALPCE